MDDRFSVITVLVLTFEREPARERLPCGVGDTLLVELFGPLGRGDGIVLLVVTEGVFEAPMFCPCEIGVRELVLFSFPPDGVLSGLADRSLVLTDRASREAEGCDCRAFRSRSRSFSNNIIRSSTKITKDIDRKMRYDAIKQSCVSVLPSLFAAQKFSNSWIRY
jgi:hypothetical protein